MKKRFTYARRFMLAGLLLCTVWVNAGDLNPPPGPINPTMRSLDQVEPRFPISSLPFTVGVPGSYYLTRDLQGSPGTHGIVVLASNVRLDLNGFALRGVPNSLNGIFVPTSGVQNVVVENGSAVGWGQSGIQMAFAAKGQTSNCVGSGNGVSGIAVGDDSCVKDSKADNNTGSGIETGDRSCVKDSSASNNGANGVKAGDDCNITQSEISNNGDDGVVCGNDCNIIDCKCNDNAGDGCSTGFGCNITQCTASNNIGNGFVSLNSSSSGCNYSVCTASHNGNHGIFACSGSTITTCATSFNTADGINTSTGCVVSNCASRANTGDGIEVSGDGHVHHNACDSNGLNLGDGAGIHVTSSDTRVENNNVSDNDRGIDVDSAGNLIIANSASGNTTNYDIVVGNSVGAINNVAANAAFVVNNAWANLEF